MINLHDYIQSYENLDFKDIVKNRLDEKHGYIPNLSKGETYDSCLISLHYELNNPEKFYKTIEDIVYEFYKEKNVKALRNTVRLYSQFHLNIELKDIFFKRLSFELESDLEFNYLVLQFLHIARLRNKDFWRHCYRETLEHFKDSKLHTNLLLISIAGINDYEILSTKDNWNYLYKAFSNVDIDTSSLLKQIIVSQWLVSNNNEADMNLFIKALCSVQEERFLFLQVSVNKNFNNFLAVAIDFLLKHKLKQEQKQSLEEFREQLLKPNKIVLKEELEQLLIKTISIQPKYLHPSMFQDGKNDKFHVHNLYSTQTPAMIMARA